MSQLLQVLGSLILVLLVFAGLVLLMKRFSALRGVATGHLRIVEALSLGSRDRLLLVQIGDRQLLLGQSPGRLQTLYVLDETLAEGSASAGTSLFASRLRSAGKKIHGGGPDT